MDSAKKKKRRNMIFAASALVLAGLLVALPFILDARQKNLNDRTSILSAQVTRGTIRKTLSGTGTLTEDDVEEVSVPQGVEVTEYLVQNGQYVKTGDALAVVDRVSVMETISTLRESMTEVEAEMDAIGSGFDYRTVISSAPGRVKAVYAERGDAVRDVIAAEGALAVISLDGKMSVSFKAASALTVGRTVTVELSDGNEVAGRVDTVIDGEVTVTVPDECGSIEEAVRILGDDGRELGSGTLSVHSPLRVIEADGTVDTVLITEGRQVSAYSELFILSGMSASGSFQQLSAEHRKYEDMMARLFVMYQDGVLSAPCDGCISGVDNDILKQLSASGEDTPGIRFLVARDSAQETSRMSAGSDFLNSLLSGNTGNSDEDGTLITQYGVVAEVNDGVITATMRDSEGTIEFVPPESEHEWEAGDIFCAVFKDGEDSPIEITFIWHNETKSGGGGSGKDGGNSSGGGSGGGSGGSGGGSGGGDVSGSAASSAGERFSTTETTILSVTPQDTVSVEITVDELDILSVSLGQQATVTLDAVLGQSFTGTIIDINTTASNEGGNSKYTAVVQMPREAYMLGGMNASVNIIVEERENALLIPSAALTEQDGKPAVYTAWDSRSEELQNLTAIETGFSDGQQVQVLSGLSEGDTVWYRYYDKLESNGLPG